MRLARRKQYGVALVEFAIVLPVLVLLLMVAAEFGRALYTYNTLNKTVRYAVRYLSMQPPNLAAANDVAVNLIVYGNPDGTGQPVATGLSESMVGNVVWDKVVTPAPSSTTINLVTVTVSGYNHTPLITSVLGWQLFPSDTLGFPPITATMRGAL